MIVGSMKSSTDIAFCGDEALMNSVGKDNLRNHIDSFLGSYSIAGDIIDVLVYCKKFEKSARPLVFTSLTINTTFGPVSSYGIDYNAKQALKIALRNAILELEKVAMEKLYGKYSAD